ncbi:TPA: hypothetical protein ACS61N_004473 [Klebsiella oxytoca]
MIYYILFFIRFNILTVQIYSFLYRHKNKMNSVTSKKNAKTKTTLMLFQMSTLVLCSIFSQPTLAYLKFDVSVSQDLNTGIATTLPINSAASYASYEYGNVAVFSPPSTLTFNTACLTASGSETWTAQGKNYTITVPASTLFSSGKVNSNGINGSDNRLTFITSGGVKIKNSCMTDQNFEVIRTVSLGENHWDYHLKGIAPAKITCNVNTPSTVDFGTIINNPMAGRELKSVGNTIVINCSQSVDGTKYNIATQINGTSGLYDNISTRLKLAGGGGYITGELGNGLTGSGACTADSGVKFDSTPIKISSGIQSGSSISNTIVWRLCSDGKSMPLGSLSASAIISVTIN